MSTEHVQRADATLHDVLMLKYNIRGYANSIAANRFHLGILLIVSGTRYRVTAMASYAIACSHVGRGEEGRNDALIDDWLRQDSRTPQDVQLVHSVRGSLKCAD